MNLLVSLSRKLQQNRDASGYLYLAAILFSKIPLRSHQNPNKKESHLTKSLTSEYFDPLPHLSCMIHGPMCPVGTRNKGNVGQ